MDQELVSVQEYEQLEQEYEDEQGVDMQKVGIKTQKTLDDMEILNKQRDAIQDMASSLCARLGIASSSSDLGGPVKNEKDGVHGNPLDKLGNMKDRQERPAAKAQRPGVHCKGLQNRR